MNLADPERDGHKVYIVHCGGNELVKIGTTYLWWPAKSTDLVSKGFKDLALLACIDGDNRTEMRVQAFFERCHVEGEWFAPDAEMLADIDRMATGTFDWQLLPARGWCVSKPYQTKASIARWGRLPHRQTYAEYRKSTNNTTPVFGSHRSGGGGAFVTRSAPVA